jgi:hypothetical protein
VGVWACGRVGVWACGGVGDLRLAWPPFGGIRSRASGVVCPEDSLLLIVWRQPLISTQVTRSNADTPTRSPHADTFPSGRSGSDLPSHVAFRIRIVRAEIPRLYPGG